MREIIFIQYLEWYFLDRTLKILRGWKNTIVSYFNYFSISILIKTLFSPWKGISSGYGRGLDLNRWIEAFVLNSMSRIIGVITRVIFLIVAVIAEFFIIVGGFLVLIIWLAAPLLFFISIYYGFSIII